MPAFPALPPERLGHSAGKSGSSQITADWSGGYSRRAHCRIWTAGPGTRPLPDGKFGWTSRAVVWYDLAVRTGAFARSLAGENFFPSGRECRGSPAACGSAAGQNPLSLFPRKKRKRLLMVSREKGLAAAFRTSSGTLAAPVTGAWPGGDLRAFAHSTTYGSYESWGYFRMHPASLFTAAPWRLREIGVGALPNALCSSFAAAPW